jgi:energy-coupling factor transporter ATP-binding protein EcfA2
VRWLTEHRVLGKVVARIGRADREVIADLPGVGMIRMNTRSADCRFEPASGADPAVLAKIDQSIVPALVRHAHGKVTLHGGAISVGSRAVAIVGPSGAGKSTLVASLCKHSGCRLVSDDTVALESAWTLGSEERRVVHVVPTQTKAWLLPEARQALGLPGTERGKVGVAFDTSSCSDLSLVAIIGIVSDDSPRAPYLRRLRGQEAFALLCNAAIRLIVDQPSAQLAEFEQLQIIARQCLLLELRRPRDIGQLKQCVEIVKRLFEIEPQRDSQ